MTIKYLSFLRHIPKGKKVIGHRKIGQISEFLQNRSNFVTMKILLLDSNESQYAVFRLSPNLCFLRGATTSLLS